MVKNKENKKKDSTQVGGDGGRQAEGKSIGHYSMLDSIWASNSIGVLAQARPFAHPTSLTLSICRLFRCHPPVLV